MRQRVLVGAIIVLILAVLIGGGYFLYRSFFGGSGTITVWTLQGTEEALADVATIAQKKYPAYKIQIKGISPQVFEYQSLFALASDKGPDVWILPNEWMEVHRAKLVPAPEGSLDSGVFGYTRKRAEGEEAPAMPEKGRTNTAIMTSDYGPIVAQDVVKGGQVWGVPLNMDTLAVFYDRTRISTPPKTWVDVANVAKNFSTRSGATVSRSAVAIGDNDSVDYSHDILSILMLQNGVDMVDESANIASFNLSRTGTAPPGVGALDYYTSFARPDKETYSWNKSLGTSLKALNDGKTMVAFGYQSDVASMTNSKIAVAPLPQVNAAKPQTYGQYFVATVTKQAAIDEETEPAWNFVSLFASPDVAEQYATATNAIPARKDVASRLKPDAKNAPFVTQVPQAVDWIKKDPSQSADAFDEAIDLVLDKAQSPQIALDVASKKYTVFLQQPLEISTDPQILSFWQSSDDQTDYTEAIEQFLDDYEDITRIDISYHHPDTYEWEVLNVMAAQQGPDILLLPHDSVARFHTTLFAFPDGTFNSSALSDKTVLERAYVPAVATDNFVNGAVYGLPASIETLMIAYNSRLVGEREDEWEDSTDSDSARKVERLLDDGPLLWDDLKELTALMTKRNGTNLTLPFIALGTGKNVAHSEDLFAVLVNQYGGEISDPDRRVTGIHLPKSSSDTSVPGQQALFLLKSFAQPQSTHYTWNKNQPNSLDALAEGKVMAAFLYPRDIATLRRKNPTLSLEFFPLPQRATNADPVDIASYFSFTLPNFSANPEAAFQFIHTAARKANGFGSPILGDASTVLDRVSNQDPQSLQSNSAISYYKGNYPDDVDQTFVNLLDDVLSLDQAAKKINQVLQQTVIEGGG